MAHFFLQFFVDIISKTLWLLLRDRRLFDLPILFLLFRLLPRRIGVEKSKVTTGFVPVIVMVFPQTQGGTPPFEHPVSVAPVAE
jgi:hypothetical protein